MPLKILHLGVFTLTKGQYQGDYALLQCNVRGTSVRVGVRITPPRVFEEPDHRLEWTPEDIESITTENLDQLLRNTRLQDEDTVILWTSQGPVFNPSEEDLPRWHVRQLLNKARKLFALPVA